MVKTAGVDIRVWSTVAVSFTGVSPVAQAFAYMVVLAVPLASVVIVTLSNISGWSLEITTLTPERSVASGLAYVTSI